LNLAVGLAIAVSKMGLIVTYFMHLRHSTGVIRLMAVVCVAWLGIMFALALGDYVSRGWPLETPEQRVERSEKMAKS